MKPISRTALPAAAVSILLVACGAGAPPSHEPSVPPQDGVVVTVRVVDEEYRIRLTDAADVDIARALLAGEEAPGIPSGVIVYGHDGGVNDGYSWHIDPESLEWADMTMEVCDGRPSDVEEKVVTSDRFCPWSAEVVAVDE